MKPYVIDDNRLMVGDYINFGFPGVHRAASKELSRAVIIESGRSHICYQRWEKIPKGCLLTYDERWSK